MELNEAIMKRRDTRHFLTDLIDMAIIDEAIQIANTAPSVGQLKPTRYILVTEERTKQAVKENFIETQKLAGVNAKKEEKDVEYNALKLEGISEAPIGMVIACDFSVLGKFSIGTVTQPKEMLLASTACAINTLWLYLTQCGLSMGWVSILDFKALSSLLNLDEAWFPMGYFCIGYPATTYDDMPMLSFQHWNSHSQPPIIIRK